MNKQSLPITGDDSEIRDWTYVNDFIKESAEFPAYLKNTWRSKKKSIMELER